MASENETIADLAQLLRRRNNDVDENFDDWNIADRIEAAHKREVDELRECLKEAVEWSCGNPDEVCEDCAAHGGDTPCKCEKWRKALDGEKSE